MDFFVIILFPVLIVYFIVYKNKQYKEGAYYKITRNSYPSVKYNKGRHAEYLTYKALRHFENNGGKFLFNIFVPKENNQTTEVDVLLICSRGLFVFECKNYGGWIFGNEAQKNWTQILPQGRGSSHKEYFYNPIMQNAAHIKHLKNLLGKNVPMQSVIVFSNRCTLKAITVKSFDTSVTNLYNVAPAIAEICNQIQTDIYTEIEINNIYNKLYPYTQCDNEVKRQHAQNISNFLARAL